MEKSINKDKINDKKNSKIKDYIEFYKKFIAKKHIICSSIFLILFITLLIIGLNKDVQIENVVVPSFFNSLIRHKIYAGFVIIFAGIVPYFYMPVLGFLFSSELVMSIISYYQMSSSILGLILNIFGGVIASLAYSYSIAVGIYYCGLSTKRFKYNQGKGFSFFDVKKSIANIRKNEDMIDKYNKEEEKRREKNEKFNVKIDYKNIAISFFIIVILLFISNIFLR